MVQSEGFILKISFYSADKAKSGTYVKATPQDSVPEDPKLKSLLSGNTVESANRILVPIYK